MRERNPARNSVLTYAVRKKYSHDAYTRAVWPVPGANPYESVLNGSLTACDTAILLQSANGAIEPADQFR